MGSPGQSAIRDFHWDPTNGLKGHQKVGLVNLVSYRDQALNSILVVLDPVCARNLQ